ncbi:MAG TPA: serine/threonine-protein kinase, partial [Planctomycetota bacterium]|nr:serine/threonine-protein kinase [Planctomycetota bacterium]
MTHDGPSSDPAWARLRALFESALDLPPDERSEFAGRACADDHELRAGLLDLLAGAEPADILRPAAACDLALGFVGWQPRPGERMGAYRIERRIASGGMGSVYEARQDQPARSVALKVMHAAVNEDASLRRFQQEAEALGRLHHHGIGAIYELGFHTTAEGLRVPFFALELIEEARDLITHAREQELDLDARLRLLIEVCAAVEHAHQKGVVHRDLKPANILVGASGAPKIIDYGVARLLEGEGSVGERTQAGVLLGTLQYMSPEQLSETSGGVDTRTDVYALGAVLYELVCGVPVYVVAQRPLAEVVREVCTGTPLAPTLRTPGLPRELDWVVLKSLEREPAQRYGSARELAADLQRLRAGEPLSAGPATRRYRVAKFVARHRVGVTLVSLTVGALLASVVSSSVALRRVRSARAAEALQAQAAAVALRRQTAVVDSLGEILGAVAPDEDGRNVTLFALLERKSSELGARLEDDPILQATLQGFLAQ